MLALGAAVGIGVGVASSVAALVALALVRWRRCRQHSPDVATQQTDMEWDNSAFNITINPLESEDGCPDEEFVLQPAVPVGIGEPGLDDVEPSGDELDVEAGRDGIDEKRTCKDLEWDDSTLN